MWRKPPSISQVVGVEEVLSLWHWTWDDRLIDSWQLITNIFRWTRQQQRRHHLCTTKQHQPNLYYSLSKYTKHSIYTLYRKYQYIIFDIDTSYCIISSKKYRIFRHITVFKNIAIYRDIFDNIAIFSTDSSLRCVTGRKDYKRDELMVS